VDALLSRRLIFVSGKGGVGKSVVAGALALCARRRGKRVLLAEVDAPRSVGRFLAGSASGPDERETLPGLYTINLAPTEVMDEYVRHTVRVGWLARRILDSPVYERFFAAAPGLKELMVLGKLMTLEQARDGWSRRPRYDAIVVDAPATGHGLSLLRVPLVASEAVPVGPVGSNARRILELLRDQERTTLAIVAIPEEMAVVEAEQFHRSVTQDVGVHAGAVVLNACHERLFSAAEEAEVLERLASGDDGPLAAGIGLLSALTAARRQMRRQRLTRFYAERLRRQLPLPLVQLPFLFDGAIGPAALRRLSERLEAA
jgi:anion-transporting  ArsA/GET3 family ATPase